MKNAQTFPSGTGSTVHIVRKPEGSEQKQEQGSSIINTIQHRALCCGARIQVPQLYGWDGDSLTEPQLLPTEQECQLPPYQVVCANDA
jgi:hypothetical protein